MVKLTAELIEQAAQYTNAIRERELDLRGYKIPVIENLGASLDQFDTIDLSDNDIRKIDGFPLLRRLTCLLVNNNRVGWYPSTQVPVGIFTHNVTTSSKSMWDIIPLLARYNPLMMLLPSAASPLGISRRIAEGLEECIPNLESMILTNNNITELGDLDPLSTLKNLRYLSMLRNPVTSKKHYRLYIIHKIPQLRLLDFQRVKQKEREMAAKLFKGKKGQQLAQDIGKRSKTFVPGEKLPEKRPTGPSKEDVAAIKAAIANAKTLEEVERLNNMLKSGQIPGREVRKLREAAVEEEEEEEMEVVNGT